ncbi:MAG: hypothetical protein M2R45_00511 [Verrucomicrobia subdivision 3 bacterium]|nr:hypothetical protein [Limisphaerales bacterium]MCS1413612.1 hypothetical protein [Limisphaerales bacterium]
MDIQGNKIASQSGEDSNRSHMQNFFDCIRSSETLNSEIEIDQKNTLMCHLGNIVYPHGQAESTSTRKRNRLSTIPKQRPMG